MKIIFAFLFCALFCAGAFAQTEEEKSSDATGVEEISLMRAVPDGNGKLSEAATEFLTTDIPIYCVVRLASTKSVAVKMNFVAVAASALKPNQTIVSVNYKTNGKSDGVTFDASPSGKNWSAGNYRVDIFLDGKSAKSMEFEIKKSVNEIEKQKPPPARKLKPKPKARKSQK